MCARVFSLRYLMRLKCDKNGARIGTKKSDIFLYLKKKGSAYALPPSSRAWRLASSNNNNNARVLQKSSNEQRAAARLLFFAFSTSHRMFTFVNDIIHFQRHIPRRRDVFEGRESTRRDARSRNETRHV